MKTPKKLRILITAAGSTIAINVIKALRSQKEIDISITAVDMKELSAGFFLADRWHVVPKADSPDFIETILDICKKEKISAILPIYSFEMPFIAANEKVIEERGIAMAISSLETIRTTHNKVKANEIVRGSGIAVPKVYSKEELVKRQLKFPVMIKPIEASGGRGVTKVNNWEEFDFFEKRIENNFVQEVAAGNEYCVDAVCDRESRLIGASPRLRMETRGGMAVKSLTVKDDALVESSRKIAETFKIVGPFNVQFFKDGNNLNFIEVNSRFPSGGLPLAARAGLNMPLIALKVALGLKIKKPAIQPDLYMTRYWDAVFVKKIRNEYKAI